MRVVGERLDLTFLYQHAGYRELRSGDQFAPSPTLYPLHFPGNEAPEILQPTKLCRLRVKSQQFMRSMSNLEWRYIATSSKIDNNIDGK